MVIALYGWPEEAPPLAFYNLYRRIAARAGLKLSGCDYRLKHSEEFSKCRPSKLEELIRLGEASPVADFSLWPGKASATRTGHWVASFSVQTAVSSINAWPKMVSFGISKKLAVQLDLSIDELIRDFCGLVTPSYGFGTIIQSAFGGEGFASCFTPAGDSWSIRQGIKFEHNWAAALNGKHRDAFVASVLNDCHLAERFGSHTVGEEIRIRPWGSLAHIRPNLWLWRLPEAELNEARDALAKASLLV